MFKYLLIFIGFQSMSLAETHVNQISDEIQVTTSLELIGVSDYSYERDTYIPNEKYASPTLIAAGAVGVVNTLAGIYQDLTGDEVSRNGTAPIGNAMPKGKVPFDLEGLKEKTYKYKKVWHDVTTLFEIASIEYEIFVQYDGSYNGKGHYLANVTFSPVNIDIMLGYDLRATSVSKEPTNDGTKSDPIAMLNFDITFTLIPKFSPDELTRDNFSLNGKTGEIKAKIIDP